MLHNSRFLRGSVSAARLLACNRSLAGAAALLVFDDLMLKGTHTFVSTLPVLVEIIISCGCVFTIRLITLIGPLSSVAALVLREIGIVNGLVVTIRLIAHKRSLSSVAASMSFEISVMFRPVPAARLLAIKSLVNILDVKFGLHIRGTLGVKRTK